MNFRQFREFLLLSRVSVTGSCNVARFSRGIFDNILRVFERIPLQIGVAEFFGGRSFRFDQRLSSLWRRLSISEKRLSIERSIDLSISLFLSFFGYHRRANEMMAEHASRWPRTSTYRTAFWDGTKRARPNSEERREWRAEERKGEEDIEERERGLVRVGKRKAVCQGAS